MSPSDVNTHPVHASLTVCSRTNLSVRYEKRRCFAAFKNI